MPEEIGTPGSGMNPQPPNIVPPYSGGVPPNIPAPATGSAPAGSHQIESFPVIAALLLHYFTCGIFSMVWLNLMHGRLPKVREDDPSAGRAIGFCFIPFFNLYWIFFTYRRLCLRVDEQRSLYGLAPSNLSSIATIACVFQVIPYLNILIGDFITFPIFLGQMQASLNQLAKASATTPPHGTLQTQPSGPGMPAWTVVLIVAVCAIPVIGLLAAIAIPNFVRARQTAQENACINNLRQIGNGFTMWAELHGDQFPFSVSTNNGGTMELRTPGFDGFDNNSWSHFRVLSNYFSNPNVLICPADSQHMAASSVAYLRPFNTSYKVHSETNMTLANPGGALVWCPIHHSVLFSDGRVKQVSEDDMPDLLKPSAENQ